jgi:hypothetical protein
VLTEKESCGLESLERVKETGNDSFGDKGLLMILISLSLKSDTVNPLFFQGKSPHFVMLSVEKLLKSP